jgi:HEAT repeat protein
VRCHGARMNRQLVRSASTLLVLLGLPASLRAHGGRYLGPGDTVPAGGGGGGGGSAAPAMPGSAGPASGTPSGAVGVSARGPGVSTGTNGGRQGPITGVADQGPELTGWEFWWGFNKYPYLNLKSAIYHDISTGSDQFFQSSGQLAPKDVLKPSPTTIRQEIVPALMAALEKERANDIVTGCLIALAKIGDVRREDGSSEFESLIAKFLADGNQEIAETAAVALGILANDSSVELLADLANDTPRGRALVGDHEVHYRTRAFATYGLGLIGARTSSDRVRRDISGILIGLLGRPDASTRDLKVAALVSFGLVPVAVEAGDDPEAQRNFASSRQGGIRFLEGLLRDETKDVLLRAHVPAALGRLLQGAPAAEKESVVKLLIAPLAPNAKERLEVRQGCVLALGQVGDADADAIDVEIRETLLRVADESRDLQSKGFALIALGQVGGSALGRGECAPGVKACRDGLLNALTRGKTNVRTWAGIGLGVLERGLQETDQGRALESSTAREALRTVFKESMAPSPMGAFAIACGIARDSEAKQLLRDRLRGAPGNGVKGDIAVALGLVGAREAVPEIQALLKESRYDPELLKQAAIGLGLLGDKDLVPDLVKMLAQAQGFSSQAAIASALGFIGDSRSVTPLVEMLKKKEITESARGFAAVALGIVADKESLPWNSKISTNIDYRANTATLTSPQATGILDIL